MNQQQVLTFTPSCFYVPWTPWLKRCHKCGNRTRSAGYIIRTLGWSSQAGFFTVYLFCSCFRTVTKDLALEHASLIMQLSRLRAKKHRRKSGVSSN